MTNKATKKCPQMSLVFCFQPVKVCVGYGQPWASNHYELATVSLESRDAPSEALGVAKVAYAVHARLRPALYFPRDRDFARGQELALAAPAEDEMPVAVIADGTPSPRLLLRPPLLGPQLLGGLFVRLHGPFRRNEHLDGGVALLQSKVVPRIGTDKHGRRFHAAVHRSRHVGDDVSKTFEQARFIVDDAGYKTQAAIGIVRGVGASRRLLRRCRFQVRNEGQRDVNIGLQCMWAIQSTGALISLDPVLLISQKDFRYVSVAPLRDRGLPIFFFGRDVMRITVGRSSQNDYGWRRRWATFSAA